METEHKDAPYETCSCPRCKPAEVDERAPSARAAYEAGRAARLAKKPRESMPAGYAAARSLSRAWLEGWASREAKEIRVAVPELRTPGAPIAVTRGAVWPEDVPFPTHFRRRPPPRPQPCERRECRALTVAPTNAQAVIVLTYTETGNTVSLLCRACGHRWKKPVS